jgi:hypothetical protein
MYACVYLFIHHKYVVFLVVLRCAVGFVTAQDDGLPISVAPTNISETCCRMFGLVS